MDVDHFRPKGRVKESPGHPGYWWLAVDWENFRYSCKFCNTYRRGLEGGAGGGKQDRFPLVDEAARATGPASDLPAEEPELLDPADASDVALLTFDLDGTAQPNPTMCGADPISARRVLTSSEVYHLNHPAIREARMMLNRQLRRDFDEALTSLPRARTRDADALRSFRSAVGRIAQRIAPEAELSATALAYLNGRKGDGDDAVDILRRLRVVP